MRFLLLVWITVSVTSTHAAPYTRSLDISAAALRSESVPNALFGANIGYWSEVNGPALAASAQEAGITVFRYHPGTYNDPHTVPGSINMWDFTAVDAFGAERLADFGRFLIATNTIGQIHVNYGAGSIEQAAALLAYLCVPTDAPASVLNRSLGASVIEASIIAPYTRTRDWRTVGFWVNLRASAPLEVDDGFNKLRLNHPAPFPVKYFECGNEADYSFVPCLRYRLPGENSITQGATGYGGRRADAHTYANFYAALKNLFHEIDPTVQVGASAGYFEQAHNDTDSPAVPFLFPGNSGTTRAWTPVVLTRLRELGVTPDFIIAHRYTQQTDFAWNNSYLLRGALNAYLAPGQGPLPRIHVTEINWAENESVPYTTTINNAVNLARSFGDALQNDVDNLCWFTFTSGSSNYDASSTTGWRRYHNWGLISDDPLAGQTPNPAALDWPGLFAGVRFPTFHAFALLKTFVRPGDTIYQASALSPANTNSHDVTVFAAKRSDGSRRLLVLNKADATHTLNLTLNGIDLSAYESTLQGSRYGKAQDEEQRLKSSQLPPLQTNNTRENFHLARSENSLSYSVPPLSVTVLTLAPIASTPPAFTSLQAAAGVVNQPFTHQVTAIGGGLTYSAGTLPPGLSFNPGTAILSGIPTSAGDFPISFSATNAAGSAAQVFQLSIRDQSTITDYTQNFSTPSGWWSYQGDTGVNGDLSQPANSGPEGASALQHAVTVSAPPATYWYAGVGVTLAKPAALTSSTLAEYSLNLQLWSGQAAASDFEITLKTGPNEELKFSTTVPGQSWTPLSLNLAQATNQNFNFSAATLEIIIAPITSNWPLASATYRLAEVNLLRNIPQDTSAQAWRRAQFADILLTGAAAWDAAPFGDGVPNLLRYVLALPTGGPLAGTHFPVEIDQENLLMTYSRRSELVGIQAYAETSTTLAPGSWTREGVQETVRSVHDNIEIIDATVPLTPHFRRFLRICVALESP